MSEEHLLQTLKEDKFYVCGGTMFAEHSDIVKVYV